MVENGTTYFLDEPDHRGCNLADVDHLLALGARAPGLDGNTGHRESSKHLPGRRGGGMAPAN
ncbi:hypothetical protein [Nonomuraea dietziae]|uniref:hypothetical protein n=1 Tax=Nonomuraea dietziae TaxID=65515 RepID=UPI0031D94CFE